jgi:Polyketide cyclase / dehydrase and lipid transport
MDTEKRSVQFTSTCRASAEVVYALLCDLPSHLVWAGEQQRGFFRLLSLDAPPGVARQGTEFTSRGTIPGSGRQFVDRSVVTQATENSVFAFTTKATVPAVDAGGMQAEFTSRYEITPLADGCRVTYTFTQESISQPMLRLSLPIVRSLTWKMGMPLMMKRGFDNLLKMAEMRSSLLGGEALSNG